MPIWLLEVSKDDGKTWSMNTGNVFYRREISAKRKAVDDTEWCANLATRSHSFGWKYRAVRYDHES